MKLLNFRFQRNGVSGRSFYHAIVTGIDKRKETFVITFEPSDDDCRVLAHTTRAVCIDSPNESWRGDEVGQQLMKFLEKRIKSGQSLYDLITLTGNKVPV